MRYVRYTDGQSKSPCWGYIEEGFIHPARPSWLNADDTSNPNAEKLLLSKATLLTPLHPGARIFCVGLNYGRHIRESGREVPAHPSLFIRSHESFSAPSAPIILPSISSKFDYEAELAIVIGKQARHIDPTQALHNVAGYTCMAENSVRDFQKHSTQATAGKNFDNSGSIGPWIVTTDEVPTPDELKVIGRLNNETMQHGSISDLIFPIAYLVSYISQFTTLLPGDVIATGTPEGVGATQTPPRFMTSGDTFEVDIPGIGTLRNTVVKEFA